MTKKNDKKKIEEKPKKKEGPNRPKHRPAKKAPSRIIRSTKQQKERNELRRRAVDRAAAQLRRFAIPFDKGDSIIICTRHKVVFAFDHPEETLEGLKKDADTSGSVLVHFDQSTFKDTKFFDTVLISAIDRKPLYAGKKSGIIPPVRIPEISRKGISRNAKSKVR